MTTQREADTTAQKRAIRRTALGLGAIAAAFFMLTILDKLG